MSKRLCSACLSIILAALSISLLLQSFQGTIEDRNSEVRRKWLFSVPSPKRDYITSLTGADNGRSRMREKYVDNIKQRFHLQEKLSSPINDINSSSQKEPKIWVSMGLCFSKNTQLYNKRKYPYAQVTPLAILLWKHFTEAEVLIRLIHLEDDINSVMEGYADSLRIAGATVEWVHAEEGQDCILKSQLIRLLAFRHPHVEDEDVVLTMDVNAFVMNDKVLEPIRDFPDMQTWILQYHDTVHGETFNQNLIALRAKSWREMLEIGPNQSMEDWVQAKVDEIGLDRDFTWYYDQWITTHSILKHRLCNAPEESALWTNPGLNFDPAFNDTDVCYHGYGYKDCNEEIHIVYEGCKWWHFYPEQTFQEHVDKFHELTNNSYTFSFLDPYHEE